MSSNALARALSSGATLLKLASERTWSRRLDELVETDRELSSDDARKVLGWFGGMGSFNDLVISQANGHNVSDEQEVAFNEELNRLRATIFDEAKSAVRDK